MRVTASAVSLNVDDVEASASFLTRHFGFKEAMSADGFVSLARPDVGFNVCYLRTGLKSLKPESLKHRRAEGLIVAFVVEDIDAEYARIQAEGVKVVTPIETEPWGERYFQVADANGVLIQLVQWMHAPDAAPGSTGAEA